MDIQTFEIPKKLTSYDISCNAVGIDFGTTECCAAVIRKNGPEFVVLDVTTGLRTMPSFIAYDEAKATCGQVVVDRMRRKAESTVYDIKRILGKSYDDIVFDPIWPFSVFEKSENGTFIEVETFNGKVKMETEQIAGDLLSDIKATIDGFEKQVLTDVVISIPSEVTESQKTATKMAAEYAGWKNIHFIPEPVAAAFAYFAEMDNIPNNSNILICDFGGGTVDICVAKIVNNNLKVLNYCGDSYLGGRDFDRLLYDHFASILTNRHGVNLAKNKKTFILKKKCQDIKHHLSVAPESFLNVSDLNPDSDDTIDITRDEFENMSISLTIRTKNVLLKAVKTANLQKQDINFVFQVGGGCRMPMIKKLLLDIFPRASHQCSITPDWIVAHGAAAYAYFIKTEAAKVVPVRVQSLRISPVISPDHVEKGLINPLIPFSRVENDFNAASNDVKYFTFPTKNVLTDKNVVGIDLGTLTCAAAVSRKNGIVTVPLDYLGQRLLPSYVAYDEKNVKCGEIVVDRLRHFSKSTIFDSKKISGKNIGEIEVDSFWPFGVIEVRGKVFLEVQKVYEKGRVSPEEVTAQLLKHIKHRSEEFQGTKLHETVITIPIAFTEKQKTATLEAAKLAGWNKVVFLPEPIAATFAYFIDPIPINSNVLFFDFGGTLNICIFKIQNDKIQIISNAGDSKLSGRDFDTVLFNYFKNALNTKHGISLEKYKKYKLMVECQKIKENLSYIASAWLDINEFDRNQDGIISINRQDFEQMAEPLLNKSKNTIHSALYSCNYSTIQIDKILCAGGGCRMPMIKHLLQNMFPNAKHCCVEHPDEVVAIGAAYYANSIFS